jgi:hypothetical protein
MRRLMHSVAMIALLALQCFVVRFVALHNWIPTSGPKRFNAASIVHSPSTAIRSLCDTYHLRKPLQSDLESC